MITSKTHDLSVTFENLGEHHMGAETLFIVASCPIAGITRFQTTNGNAFFTPDGNGLFIHDACVILYFDIRNDDIFNLQHPQNWFFTDVRTQGSFLTFDLYDASGHHKSVVPIPLSHITSEFVGGFGAVENGRFPSAYP